MNKKGKGPKKSGKQKDAIGGGTGEEIGADGLDNLMSDEEWDNLDFSEINPEDFVWDQGTEEKVSIDNLPNLEIPELNKNSDLDPVKEIPAVSDKELSDKNIESVDNKQFSISSGVKSEVMDNDKLLSHVRDMLTQELGSVEEKINLYINDTFQSYSDNKENISKDFIIEQINNTKSALESLIADIQNKMAVKEEFDTMFQEKLAEQEKTLTQMMERGISEGLAKVELVKGVTDPVSRDLLINTQDNFNKALTKAKQAEQQSTEVISRIGFAIVEAQRASFTAAEASAKMDRASENIEQSFSKSEELLSNIENYKNELTDLLQNAQDVIDRIENSTKAETEKVVKISEEAMEKFQNSIAVFDNACNRANEFEQKIQDLSSVVNQSHSTVEQFSGDVNDMKAKVEEIATKGKTFEEDILENISVSEQSLEKAKIAEEKADNILKTFSGLVQKVDGLETKSSFISEKLMPLENKFLSLESSMGSFEQKASSSLSEMMEMERRLSDAINNFNDILARSEKASSEAKSINQQFNILKSATDGVKEQADQVTGVLNGLTERISRTDRDIKNVEKRSEFMLEIALQKSKAVDIDEELVEKLNKTSSRAEQMYSKVGELKKELEVIDKTIKDTLSWAAQKSYSPSIVASSVGPVEDIEIPSESDLPLELDDLLQVLVEHKASDLHLKVGSTPYVRLDSVLIPVGAQVLTEKDTLRLIAGVMTKPQRCSFKKNCGLNFTYTMSGGMRFRINAFYEKGMISAAIKMLQSEIPTFEKINLPVEEFHRISELPSGIVLIAGPVLSGKSTTIASIINYINQIKKLHIVTIEDTIEFLYRDRKSIISQREIGTDTPSLVTGLDQALYQDPDVIVAGEIKDLETLKLVNTAAEAGKLVFANVRSDNAVQAMEKLLNLYGEKDANYFRYLFSNNLKAVICQKLIKTEQSGILPVLEILWISHEIQKSLIQEQYSEIYSLMSESQNKDIINFSDFLNNLVKIGKITEEEFIKYRSLLTPHLGQESNKNDSFGDTMLSWL